jgi:hypothetical protein
LLQVRNNLKQIPGLGVAAGAEHSHQAFRRATGHVAELRESNRSVYEVAKDDLAGFHVTGKKVFDSLPEKRFAKARIAFCAGADGVFEISG